MASAESARSLVVGSDDELVSDEEMPSPDGSEDSYAPPGATRKRPLSGASGSSEPEAEESGDGDEDDEDNEDGDGSDEDDQKPAGRDRSKRPARAAASTAPVAAASSAPEKDAAGTPSGGKQRTSRCGQCAGCQASNCGKCSNCLDMPAFGGPGTKRQVRIHAPQPPCPSSQHALAAFHSLPKPTPALPASAELQES